MFASNAATADIAATGAKAHAVTGNYLGSATDTGTANGIEALDQSGKSLSDIHWIIV